MLKRKYEVKVENFHDGVRIGIGKRWGAYVTPIKNLDPAREDFEDELALALAQARYKAAALNGAVTSC